MANTRIGRTVSVAGSRRKATFSAWVKRTGLGEAWIAKFGGDYSQGNMMQIGFDSNDSCFIVGDIPTASATRLQSTRKFRDTNAWYHYVVAFDTEQSTASNRVKFYINGEQVTSFGTETYPTQNLDLAFNRTGTYNNAWLGGRGESTYEFNGLMSHVHWCDGYAYAPSAFGSTDATTGEWKINTSPSVTYGTNGYFMLKDGNSLTDASGNGNNFSSLVGTLTKTEDNPSNVFATWNPLIPSTTNYVYSNGNNTINQTSGSWVKTVSTLGMTKGKYYWEVKTVSADTSAGKYTVVGVANTTTPTAASGMPANGIGYKSNGEVQRLGSITNIGAYTAGDIISCYLDMDNEALYYAKNGVMLNSGVPTSGASKTGAFTMPVANSTYFASLSTYGTKAEANFGEGFFGTTAAGTQADDNGQGLFAYDVPAGYYALNTKNLEAYG